MTALSLKINPLNPLFMVSPCLDGCDFADSVDVEFKLYSHTGTSPFSFVWNTQTSFGKFMTGNYNRKILKFE
jgi:hypothetical protein